MNTNSLDILKEIGLSGFIDILLMSLLIYAVLVWFKKTKVAFVITGILICAIIYLLSYQFNLFLVSSVLQGFFAVILIAVIVIFQEELRYLFEQIAVWSFNPNLKKTKNIPQMRHEVEILSRSIFDLARENIGALIVLRGKDLIMRHLQGGTDLNGELSESLLKSIFDPNSMGHDGAMIIEQGLVTRFSAHLPLSKNFSQLKKRGTRHAAALGISELSDALCLVSSEEQGTVSVARHGEIQVIPDGSTLARILEFFFEEIKPKTFKSGGLKEFFRHNTREKITAVIITMLLWLVLVRESELLSKTYKIPVEYPPLSNEFFVKEMEPNEVVVSFSGPRSAFHFLNDKNIRLTLSLFNVAPGERNIPISKANLTIPKDVMLESMEPRKIRVVIEKKEPTP